MKNTLAVISAIFILSACNATQAPPYDKSKAPAERENYSGLKGASQKIEDEAFAENKEKMQKCDEARFDLIDAQAKKDEPAVKQLQAQIRKLCS